MNLEDILRDHRIHFDTSGKGKNRQGWINMKCCYCGRDPYLGYSIDGRAFSCWNCGTHGVAETLARLTGMSYAEANQISRGLPKTETTIKRRERGKLVLPNDLGPLQSVHKKYLKSRGFDPDRLVQLWNLQGIGKLGGRLAWRIFIPVYLDGEIVTWTTRRITNAEPRYLSASPAESILPIDQCLYGIDYCRTAVLCVEGPADVWALGPGSVCCFGLRFSDTQKETLSKFPLRGTLLDGGSMEAAAQRRAREICRQLSILPGTTLNVILETGNDPASASEEELTQVRNRFLK